MSICISTTILHNLFVPLNVDQLQNIQFQVVW